VRRLHVGLAGLALLLSACGTSVAVPERGPRVCLVTDTGGLGDHGFNHLAAVGIQAATGRLGGLARALESREEADFASNLAECVRWRAGLVVAGGPGLAEAVGTAATLHPSASFLLIDAAPVWKDGKPQPLRNVASMFFKEQESGYLAGVLTGLMEVAQVGTATRGVVGVLGTAGASRSNRYVAGFVAGVRSVSPTLVIKLASADPSAAPSICRDIGQAQVAARADILFQAAGRCGAGYLDAAYQARVYAIGSEVDQAYLGAAVISSALKRVDRAVKTMVARFAAGTFAGGEQLFSLQNEGTGIAPPSSIVPQDIVNQLEVVRENIRSGAVTPPEAVPPG